MNHVLSYYSVHSRVSDPGKFRYLFEELESPDISYLVQVVRGMLFQPDFSCGYDDDSSGVRLTEKDLLTVEEKLAKIADLCPKPLDDHRTQGMRVQGGSRDFSLLLVSLLRHFGIPARIRVGFADYGSEPDSGYEIRHLAEYWNNEKKMWVLVDPQLDPRQCYLYNTSFDPLNIEKNSLFMLPGFVWKLCRQGIFAADEFGSGRDRTGLKEIRTVLLYDFDALNKNELITAEGWHPLINKPDEELAEEELMLLDEIAELTMYADSTFYAMANLYRSCGYSWRIHHH